MSDVTEKFEGDKDLPPLTPISIDDPVFEDIIDSPPAPMMLASAAAILYDWESQTKNEGMLMSFFELYVPFYTQLLAQPFHIFSLKNINFVLGVF